MHWAVRIAGRVTVHPNKKGQEGRDDGEIGYKIIRDYYDLIAFTSPNSATAEYIIEYRRYLL